MPDNAALDSFFNGMATVAKRRHSTFAPLTGHDGPDAFVSVVVIF